MAGGLPTGSFLRREPESLFNVGKKPKSGKGFYVMTPHALPQAIIKVLFS